MKTKIENFLLDLETDVDIISTVDIGSIDFNNAFDSIVDMVEENNGFDIDIIYYDRAMEYLMENDTSLQESLTIAYECGFDVLNINSEILASLLSSNIAREEFYQLEDEINDFFAELSNNY